MKTVDSTSEPLKANPLYLNGVQPPFLSGFVPSINWNAPTIVQAAYSTTFKGKISQQQLSHVTGKIVKGAVIKI